MLTVRNAAKGVPREVLPKQEGIAQRAAPAPSKGAGPPVDTVVLTTQVKVILKEEEYLVATYWG